MELTEIIQGLQWEEKRPVLEAISEEKPTIEAQTMLIEYQIRNTNRMTNRGNVHQLAGMLNKLHRLKKKEREEQRRTFTSKVDYDQTYTTIVNALEKLGKEFYSNPEQHFKGLNTLADVIERDANPSVGIELIKQLYEKTSYSPWQDEGEIKVYARQAASDILTEAARVTLKLKYPKNVEWVVDKILEHKRYDKKFTFNPHVLLTCAMRLTQEAGEDWGDGNRTANNFNRSAINVYILLEDHIKEKCNAKTFCSVAKSYDMKKEFETAEKWYKDAIYKHLKQGRCEEAFEIVQYITSEEYLERKVSVVTVGTRRELSRLVDQYKRLIQTTPEFEEGQDTLTVMKRYHGELKEAMKKVEKKESELKEQEQRARKTWHRNSLDELRELAINYAMKDNKYQRAHDIAVQVEASSGSTKRTQTVIAMYNMLH